jgi:branched-chain amino acid transport system substrate-binding protein
MLRALSFSTALLASACSFTTAGNFEECKTDLDCGTVGACSQGFCLPLPADCRREEAGGRVKAFETPDRIPLVALLPLSERGQADDTEVQGLNAMKLAISEANDRQGVRNKSFGLFVCNTQRDRNIAAKQGAWFIENLRVPAVLTSGTGDTKGVASDPTRLDAGTFIMATSATGTDLTSVFRTNGSVWRVPPSDLQQARVLRKLVQTAYPDAGGVRVDVMYVDDDYGSGLGNALTDELLASGYVSERRPLVVDDIGKIGPVVTNLANASPRATVVVALPPYVREIINRARVFRELTRDGGHQWFLADGAKDPAVLRNEDGGVASTLVELDQALGTAPAQGAGGAFAAFRDSFRTRYGIDPNSFSYTGHNYDATWLVMLATAAATGTGTVDGPALTSSMGKLSTLTQPPVLLRADSWTQASNDLLQGLSLNVEGASGALDFDGDAGVPSAPYEVWQVSDGGIRVLRLVNP